MIKRKFLETKISLIYLWNKQNSLKLTILTISLIAIIIGFQSAYAPSHPEFSNNLTTFPLYHFNKGTVDENSAFAGEVIWTLFNGTKGVIVHSSDHGVVVVRLDLTLSDECIKSERAFCLDGVVTSFKNTVSHNVGEDVKFIVDLTNKHETISMINGPLAGIDVRINLSKIRMPEQDIN